MIKFICRLSCCCQKSQQEQKTVKNPKVQRKIQPNEMIVRQKLQTSQEVCINRTKQKNIKLQINQTWMSICKTQKNQLHQLIKSTLHEYIKSSKCMVKLIIDKGNQILDSIKSKHFVVNINILEMIRSKNFISLINRSTLSQQIITSQTLSQIENKDIPMLIRNIQEAIIYQYNILGSIVGQKQKKIMKNTVNQNEIFFSQMKKVKDKQNFQSHKLKFITVFQDFMKKQMVNQYLYIVKCLLIFLQSMSHLGQYHYSLYKKWIIYQQKIKKTGYLKIFQQSDYHIENAKQQLKTQNKKVEKYASSSSSASNSKKDHRHESKSQKQQNIYDLVQSSMEQRSTGGQYIKFYTNTIKTTNQFVRSIVSLKYIPLSPNEVSLSKYKLLSLLKQNQMNVLRYFQKSNQQFIMRFKIKKDERSQNEDLLKQFQEKQTECFQFISQKGDKDYSKLYKLPRTRQNLNIVKATLWGFKNKKTIYSFLKCFALIIQILEKHSLHQTDFQFQNFIKFGNIFELIDLGAVFFVKSNIDSKKYFQLNEKIFECWLNSTLTEQLSCLTATYKQYQKIRQRYYKDGETLEDLENKKYSCIGVMQTHMKINHYNQFQHHSKQFLSFDLNSQLGSLFTKQQINKIRAIIPNNVVNLNFRYNQFINKLQNIYQQFNSELPQKLVKEYDKPYQLICKQFTNLSSYIKHNHQPLESASKEKILSFIKLMQLKSFNNICTFYFRQIRQINNNIFLCSQDNNRKIPSNAFENERYIILFLKSCISLIEQLQSQRFIILNLSPQLFAQFGQKFILKNLAYVFKIKKGDSIISLIQQQIQDQLITYSCKCLTMLILNDGIWKQKNQRLFAKIQKNIDNPQINFFSLDNISTFFYDNMAYIHFTQFKKIALSLLIHNKQIMNLVNEKDQTNYFQLQSQLPQLIDHSY